MIDKPWLSPDNSNNNKIPDPGLEAMDAFFLTMDDVRENALASIRATNQPGFKSGVGIEIINGGSRILRIEIPIEQKSAAVNILNNSRNTVSPLGQTPVLRSNKDNIFVFQGLIAEEKYIEELKGKFNEENLNVDLRFSGKTTSVIEVNGAVGTLKKLRDDESDKEVVKFFKQNEKQSLAERKKLINPIMPRLGPCSYLILDQETLFSADDTDPNIKNILDHIAFLADSNDFHFFFDQMGNMVVLALNERAIGFLSKWSVTLRNLSDKKANLYIGKGKIIKSTRNDLVVEGYLQKPDLKTLEYASTIKPQIYSSSADLAEIQGSRDETSVQIDTDDIFENLLALQVTNKVNLVAGGGPDRFIGCENEFNEVTEALTIDNPTRIIFIEAKAGMGKSKLIKETTKNMKNALVISIDPGGRACAGSGLVYMLEQIAVFIQERFPSNENDLPAGVKCLLEFNEKISTEKNIEANRFAFPLEFYCEDALRFLSENLTNFVLVIDDVHHIDRHSDPHIMNVVRGITTDDSLFSKVVLLRRPGKRYASVNQESLRNRGNDILVQLQNEDESSKLNLSIPEIANAYAFYSLPEQFRFNNEISHSKFLGSWVSELGKLAKTPFQMTSYLKGIFGNIKENLLIQRDRIEITTTGQERIKYMQGKEMSIYHLDRINEELSPEALNMLQALALIGRKELSKKSIVGLGKSVFNYSTDKTEALLRELIETGDLIPEENGLELYQIWHENIRDIVLQDSMNDVQRANLALKVFEYLKNTNLVPASQHFSILHNAVAQKNADDADFWKEYFKYAYNALIQAKNGKLYAQGFAIANEMLGGLDLTQENPNTIIQSINKMVSGQKVPDKLFWLIINGLMAIAENGFLTGQFEVVYKAAKVAESIQEHFNLTDIELPQFYKIAYNSAYAHINNKQLEYFYRKQDFEACKKIIAVYQNESEDDIPAEITRLRIRIELEDILEELRQDGFDGDVGLSGLDMNEKQRAKVVSLNEETIRLREIFEGNRGSISSKKKLNPVDELHLLDIEAQLASLVGNNQEAIRTYGESWRIAMQMDIPKEAARAAKQKGDAEIIYALVYKMWNEGEMFYRQHIKNAIQTYSEDGLSVAETLPDKSWKFFLSVQRLRALCLLLESYDANKERRYDIEEITHYLTLGAIDIDVINTSYWASVIPASAEYENKADFEVSYYVTPLIIWYRKLCKKFKTSVEFEELAFEQVNAYKGAMLFSCFMTEDKLGELKRKFKQLNSVDAYTIKVH